MPLHFCHPTGTYAGRVLKGEKPGRPAYPASDQVRVRRQSADRRGALSLEVPAALLAIANEVIE